MIAIDTPPITLSELSRRFGAMPAHRIRMDRYPADESDLLDLHDHQDVLCELKDGVLVEKTVGFQESFLAVTIVRILGVFVFKHDLGVVTGPDGMMRLDIGLVRIPDVSFISWNQFPERKVPPTPIPDLYPDLAVEVLNISNTEKEMDEKLDDYFNAGTSLVWYVDPKPQTVRVYTSRKRSRLLTAKDTLDGGKVLPGFSVKVSEFFAGI